MSSKNQHTPAVQQIQNAANLLVDELEITNNSDEKKAETLTKVANTIDEVLKKIKNKEISIKNFAMDEKIELLQKTKMAVQELLIQILSGSTQNTSRAYEALAAIIKVNADIIRNLEETEGLLDQSNRGNSSDRSDDKEPQQIIIAPSEAILEGIMNRRHDRNQQNKVVNTHVEKTHPKDE